MRLSRFVVLAITGTLTLGMSPRRASAQLPWPCIEVGRYDDFLSVPQSVGLHYMGSPDALYRYRTIVDPTQCGMWTADWLLYPHSYNPDWPNADAYIPVCFTGDAHYLPSSAVDVPLSISPPGPTVSNMPVTEPDCSSYNEQMQLWRKKLGESEFTMLGIRSVEAYWDGEFNRCYKVTSTDTFPRGSGSCYLPPDLNYGSGDYDTYRTLVSMTLRTTQTVRAAAYIEPGAPP